MDAQTLERLLIDRALGVLPPDTNALVEAYLATDAAAAKAAGEMGDVVGCVQRVLEEEVPALPPIDRARLMHAEKSRRRGLVLRGAWAAMGIAACVAVGMMLGHGGGGVSRSVVPTVTVASASVRPTAGVPDFWSESRLRVVATQPHPAQRPYHVANGFIFNGFPFQGDPR